MPVSVNEQLVSDWQLNEYTDLRYDSRRPLPSAVVVIFDPPYIAVGKS